MKTVRIVLAARSLLALALGVPCVSAAQVATPELKLSEANRLVKDLVSGDEKKAGAARTRLVAVRPADRPLVFDALESGPPPPKSKQRDRRVVSEIPTPEAKVSKSPFVLRLPDKGKPPFPVLFRLHGSGDEAEDFDGWANDSSAFGDFLLVTPQIPSTERQGWSEPGALEMLDRLYRQIVAQYPVDTDRIYLSGFSAGGGGSFVFAQTWPHRFAGFYAIGRLWWAWDRLPEASMDVARHVPGFFVVGLDDKQERIDGFRKAQAYYEKTRLPGEFHFVPGKGHEYLSDFDRPAVAYLTKSRRVRYPKEFRALFFFYAGEEARAKFRDRQYWLEAIDHDFETTAAVRVEGDTIHVDAPDLEKGAVLVNDRIVDLDRPVKLVRNGELVFEGTVERSVEFLLDGFAVDHDPGSLYWNRIPFGE